MLRKVFKDKEKQVKECWQCGRILPYVDFHKNRSKSDGLTTQCRDCVGKNSRIYYHRDVKKSRLIANERSKRAYRRNPLKAKVRLQLREAVRKSLVIKTPCAECGKPSEAHHPDYSKPFDVIWLCRTHHGRIHRKNTAITILEQVKEELK